MSKYIPPPPVRPTEPKTKVIIENGTIPTPPKAPEGPPPREIIDNGVVPEKTVVFRREYAEKKPSVPKPPPILERYSYGRSAVSKGVSGNDVMLGLFCLLIGVIFGLLIGRFV